MEQENKQENRFEETMIEGRNAVLEAFRSGKTVDKLCAGWLPGWTGQDDHERGKKAEYDHPLCGEGETRPAF